MKLHKFIVSFLLTFNSIFIFSQADINNALKYNVIPQEKIFVHHNTSLLISGEYLLYKIYCLNNDNDKLSNVSKIAYIELISSNKTIVFKHKIKLDNGLGNGDFFISTTIPSGNYKLIAYTQWMRNKAEDHFFQSDITIINPFNKEQKNFFTKEKSDSILNLASNNSLVNFKSGNKKSRTYLNLNLSKKIFTNREKVQVNINSLKDKLSDGNYSLSVRKVVPINKINTPNSTNYFYPTQQQPKKKHKNLDTIYLPELRGELISGKVLFKTDKKPVSNINIALSIPGKNYILKVANTNDSGIFYFNINEEYENTDATIQVIDDDIENYEIELMKPSDINYTNLKFSDFKIMQEMSNFILQRSIYNQIENAYQNEKLNSIDSIKSTTPFFESIAKIYNLDDYTRFLSIKETIVEVIDEAFITERRGIGSLHVRGALTTNILPLVLVDGVIINNHNDIINYSAHKIKSVSLVRNKYIYSTKIFNGILSFKTINGDYRNSNTKDYIEKIKLQKPLRNKIYFEQDYNESGNLKRIPDYRNQLLWLPNFKLDKKEKAIEFFTSDNKGDYEICLEGFTNEGKPVSLKEIITVK